MELNNRVLSYTLWLDLYCCHRLLQS